MAATSAPPACAPEGFEPRRPWPSRQTHSRTEAPGLLKTLPILLLLCFLCPGWLSAAPAPESFVARTQARIEAARSLAGATARRQACAALVADAFDAPAVARAAAGESWTMAGAAARRGFADAVGRRLAGECTNLLDRPERGEVSVRRVRQTPDGVRVTAQLQTASGPGSVFVWSLAPGGPLGWRATDLSIDGRGVVATLHGDLEALLTAQGGHVEAAMDAFAAGASR